MKGRKSLPSIQLEFEGDETAPPAEFEAEFIFAKNKLVSVLSMFSEAIFCDYVKPTACGQFQIKFFHSKERMKQEGGQVNTIRDFFSIIFQEEKGVLQNTCAKIIKKELDIRRWPAVKLFSNLISPVHPLANRDPELDRKEFFVIDNRSVVFAIEGAPVVG